MLVLQNYCLDVDLTHSDHVNHGKTADHEVFILFFTFDAGYLWSESNDILLFLHFFPPTCLVCFAGPADVLHAKTEMFTFISQMTQMLVLCIDLKVFRLYAQKIFLMVIPLMCILPGSIKSLCIRLYCQTIWLFSLLEASWKKMRLWRTVLKDSDVCITTYGSYCIFFLLWWQLCIPKWASSWQTSTQEAFWIMWSSYMSLVLLYNVI